MPLLPNSFYARPTLEVAHDLLGTILVHESPSGTEAGRIVEVEAYLGPEDEASHSRFGPGGRSRIMFGPPGRVYVYLIYGMHHCMNVVTESDGVAGAVLIRAIEAGDGLTGDAKGPGLVCRALGIDRTFNHHDLTTPPLYLKEGRPPQRVQSTPRIGVSYAGDWANRPFRFVDAESNALSRRVVIDNT